jgi:hypothetical protein
MAFLTAIPDELSWIFPINIFLIYNCADNHSIHLIKISSLIPFLYINKIAETILVGKITNLSIIA